MIVFVLRHADREDEPTDDLTPAGQERAELLARMLADSKVSLAYRTHFVRARKTLEPLEKKLSGSLTVREFILAGNTPTQAHVRDVVQAVKSQPADAVIVVVGHSDTVGPIIEGLGGELIVPIGPNEFDRFFVLFIDPPDRTTVLRLRYGAAT